MDLAARLPFARRPVAPLPAAVELAAIYGIMFLYSTGRLLVIPDSPDAAVARAEAIVRFEAALGLFIEPAVQGFAVARPTLVRFLNTYYSWIHFTPLIMFLAWAYLRDADKYRILRTTLLAALLPGLLIHWLLPTAPPRFTPGVDLVDTRAEYGLLFGATFTGDAPWTNRYAALPSFHFGWSLFIALGMAWVERGRWRWLFLLHPLVVLWAIVATGNHWWIDAVVGAGVLGGVFAVVHRVHPATRPARDPAPAPEAATP